MLIEKLRVKESEKDVRDENIKSPVIFRFTLSQQEKCREVAEVLLSSASNTNQPNSLLTLGPESAAVPALGRRLIPGSRKRTRSSLVLWA